MPPSPATPLPPDGQSKLGDPDSWIDQHGDALLRFALLRVNDVATAEDLVQETLLAAWRGRDGFDGACEPRTWLVAIMKRRIADHYRVMGRRPAPAHAAEPNDPAIDAAACEHRRAVPADLPVENAEFWSVVSKCTADMPEHLARAFRLRTFGAEEPTRICDAEGITRKNLSVRLHRARLLLKRCLESRWFGSVGPRDGLAG